MHDHNVIVHLVSTKGPDPVQTQPGYSLVGSINSSSCNACLFFKVTYPISLTRKKNRKMMWDSIWRKWGHLSINYTLLQSLHLLLFSSSSVCPCFLNKITAKKDGIDCQNSWVISFNSSLFHKQIDRWTNSTMERYKSTHTGGGSEIERRVDQQCHLAASPEAEHFQFPPLLLLSH